MKNLSDVKQRLLLALSVLALSGCFADLKDFSSGRSADSSFQTQSVAGGNSSMAVPSSEKRVALVIGNDAYTSTKKLPTLHVAVNDAKAIASTLKNLGFEVIYAEDANKQQLVNTEERRAALLEKFANEAKGGALALFYFAGHGMQYRGENFLIPVDFNDKDFKNIPKDSLHANEVLTVLEQTKVSTRILILDACRNWHESWGEPGLNEMRGSAKFGFGTLIVFSTEPGTQAADRMVPTDTHSPFAKALLKYMPQGSPVQVMFTKVQNEVYETTKGNLASLRGDDSGQAPWVTLSPLGDGGDLCLAPCVPNGTNICKIPVGKGLYDGECQNGIPHGQGVLRYPNGEYYQGSFSNGVRHGKGVQYLTNGTEVRGEWVNGRLK